MQPSPAKPRTFFTLERSDVYSVQEVRMSSERVQRPESPESRSDASPSAPDGTRHAAIAPERERIAKRTYEIAGQRGFSPGQELDDWLQAEREIEAGPPRNPPPDNSFDEVRTSSNE
jgi:Protein of unknown function (DUF2934)